MACTAANKSAGGSGGVGGLETGGRGGGAARRGDPGRDGGALAWPIARLMACSAGLGQEAGATAGPAGLSVLSAPATMHGAASAPSSRLVGNRMFIPSR